MTFCSGVKCSISKDCYRWTKNLERMAKERGIDLEGRRISLSSFGGANACTMFEPMEEAEHGQE